MGRLFSTIISVCCPTLGLLFSLNVLILQTSCLELCLSNLQLSLQLLDYERLVGGIDFAQGIIVRTGRERKGGHAMGY